MLLNLRQAALISQVDSDRDNSSGTKQPWRSKSQILPANGSIVMLSGDEYLVRASTALRQSPMFENIADRGKAGKLDESWHWCELQHFIGRLASYSRALQVIFRARRRHPELFHTEDLEVRFIGPSEPLRNPMKAFQAGLPPSQRTTSRSASDIISRMTSDRIKQEAYQHYADELERCGLNRLIAAQCRNENFKPIAHSEVLLLEWLREEFAAQTHPIPFYDNVKYIGCSKPTCRLCDYYFAAHDGGVGVRPSHRNVYANWVIPDVFVEGQTSRYKARMIDAVLTKIRQDVFLALSEKVSERKRFDSETYSSLPTYRSATGVPTSPGGPASLVEDVSLAGPARAPRLILEGDMAIGDDAWSAGAQDDNAKDEDNDDDDDDDDDGGGTLLFTGRNT
ncbi:hypothetical protein LY76DRAFT_588538 [Colletotrichum caudatum]|nr:hypothetical protein LY76DRAFT_588538 [Colletotrichum caudatum]